jgi:hypothetical protein
LWVIFETKNLTEKMDKNQWRTFFFCVCPWISFSISNWLICLMSKFVLLALVYILPTSSLFVLWYYLARNSFTVLKLDFISQLSTESIFHQVDSTFDIDRTGFELTKKKMFILFKSILDIDRDITYSSDIRVLKLPSSFNAFKYWWINSRLSLSLSMSIESRYCVVQRSRIQIRNKGQKAEKDKKAKLKGFGFLVWTNLTKGFFF